jgi:subtilisin family serine protease
MNATRLVTILSILSLSASALTACGGASEDTSDHAVVDATGDETAAPANPWDALDDAALVALVREQAVARAHEAEPDLDLSQRAAWIASPDSAPELGDRVSEQLFNLAIADLAAGDLSSAMGTVRLVRARARNRNNSFAGTSLLAISTRMSAAMTSSVAPATAVAQVFRELPRARFGAATVLFQIYQDQTQADAIIEQTREQLVSLDTAITMLFARHLLGDVIANRAMYLEAIGAVRAENDARPADPDYAFGTVDLTRARDATEVMVAVWDTGVSDTLFAEQLFTAPDGSHGVISDPVAAQTGTTFEPGESVITEYAPFLRGVMDLRAGMASTEAAQRVLTLMRSATDAASLDVLESHLDEVGEWAHGTHVAGILLNGLPQARLSIFRSAWAGESRVYHHRGPTDAELDAERANVEAIAAFINTHHVRVVNASLGFTQDYLEAELRHESSVYSNDDEVRARAAAVQARRRANWAWIFEACPETLFVVAAGNSNRDVLEYQDVSASIEAPNVLVVGAVDRFGNWATFTNSNPELVRLFDFGVEVDSVIPNGEHVPLSGTSMASPNAANLAAKMISVNAALTPVQVIEMMLASGDPIAAPFNGVIANETAALARVRRARPRARR